MSRVRRRTIEPVTHARATGHWLPTARWLVALSALMILTIASAGAQPVDDPLPIDTTGSDSLTVRTTRVSGFDTLVSYGARDSIIKDLDQMKIKLYGDARVDAGSRHLTAEYIEIDLHNSILYAEAGYDSTTKRYYGVPTFKEGSQQYSARTITYNFKTQRGTASAVQTVFDGGYYAMDHIKRVADNVAFGDNAVYTTCDESQPHYHFSSEKMKVIVGDRIFIQNPTLNIAGVPILYIPVGVYFPSNKGKQSGLVIPRWSQTTTRGFTLEGLGYFWDGGPIGEYFDNLLTADIYSKGGFTLHNFSRFRLRGVINQADLRISGGMTRDDPDLPLQSNLIVEYAHNMPVGRRGTLGGTLRFSSDNAIRNTTLRSNPRDQIDDITTQEVRSNFSFNTTTDWGASLSVDYSRRQNIITQEFEQTLPGVVVRFPTWTPFAKSTGERGIFDDLSISSSISGAIRMRADTVGGQLVTHDPSSGININPSISIRPKISYFTISPFLNTSGSLFFRRKVIQPVGDTIRTDYISRLFPTFSYDYGLSVQTSLFGIVRPRLFGVNAIRHVLTPSVTYRYTPELGSEYVDQYFDPRINRIVEYSIFADDAGIASAPRSQRRSALEFSIQNSFDAKIAQGDTVEDKTVNGFLTLSLRSSYDLAADSFRLQPISINGQTRIGILDLSGYATLDPYAYDTLSRSRIDETVFGRGEGLGRITSAGFTFGTQFSSEGIGTTTSTAPPVDTLASERDPFDFGPIRFNEEEFYGERVRGEGGFSIPWSARLDGVYSVIRNDMLNEFTPTFTVTTSFSFSLTRTIQVSSSVQYNFMNGEFNRPNFVFTKDLHCWEMRFEWSPFGVQQGFYFRIGLKAPQLQDIKYEMQGYGY